MPAPMSKRLRRPRRHSTPAPSADDPRRHRVRWPASAPHPGRSVRRDPRRTGGGGAQAIRRAGFRRGLDRRDRRGGGVTRGALYHQFADKTALFDAVLDVVEAASPGGWPTTWPPPGSPIQSTPCGACCGPGSTSASSRRFTASPSSTGNRSSAGRTGGRCASGTSSGWRRHARAGIEAGRIRPQPSGRSRTSSWAPATRPPCSSRNRPTPGARAEMLQVLDRLDIDGYPPRPESPPPAVCV